MTLLYHRTSSASADRIARTKRFNSFEANWVYFSTHAYGSASGFGDAIVRVSVPDQSLEPYLDDEFPNGEQHYRVPQSLINPDTIVRIR